MFTDDEYESDADIVENIEKMMREASAVRKEVEQLKEERLKMAESVGRQLTDRDTTHIESVKNMEAVSVEKEKQLLQSSNLLRQQLAAAKKDGQQMQKQLAQLKSINKLSPDVSPAQEEMDSLRQVLNIKKGEVEQLRAEKNSLMLELQRVGGLELRLKVHKQRMEDMEAVISLN